ncbi:hypothetical protein L288_18840 [Sphingobium quisquiliarum P25]|jgi:hypothetical protein|uniref:Uncharacterized protein n=1 Tax=Sphingobium quisquiliarum P25 TaxID=1329909 RepID=T0G893_9SPHN|nr:hypothetical protein L288_18840 [Sphingobium quisquiliarum P25]EZP73620.1 hypothetical protein BV96_01061 [Sphingomonas paucimobilis]
MIFEIAVNQRHLFRTVTLDLDEAEEAGLMASSKRIGCSREAWDTRPQWGRAERHVRWTVRLGRKTYCFEVDRPLR